jgi:ATP-binding cassette, subfamily B, bacterial
MAGMQRARGCRIQPSRIDRTPVICSFIKPLIEFAWPHRLALALGTLFMVAETAVALTVPWLGGRFATDLLGGDRPSMLTVLLLIAGLFSVQALLRVIGGYVFAKRAALILADIRVRLYDHIQSLPMSFFQSRQQGALLSVLSYDVAVLSHFISGTLVGIVPMLMTVLGSVIFMLSIDAWMALAAAVAIPVFYLLIKVAGRSMRPVSIQLQEAHGQAFAVEEENISMLPAIKVFTREGTESARYQQRVKEIVRLTLQQQWSESALGPGVQWIAGLGVLVILWLAGDRIDTGRLATGELVAFLLYATVLTRPVSALAGVYGQTQRARASMDRVGAVLSASPERYLPTAPTIKISAGRIEMLDISFAYPEREMVLKNFSLHVAAGETIALTGENGTGKTTIISLLMRLLEPQAGRILIDGVDISTVNLTSLRSQIAVVTQQVYLFNGSVRDNIGYGLPGADESAIRHASELAQAHHFIASLPNGYDTVIGDHGVRLSGGQRQRIALARALLKNPPILILDEATAMFDPEAELHFLEDCRDVLRARTVLLITHRPASLALADRVIHLSSAQGSAETWPRIDVVKGTG